MRRRAFLQSSVVLAFAGPLSSPIQAALSGRYEELGDMPFASQEIYPCLFQREGRSFLLSGGGIAVRLGDPVLSKMALYDLQTHEWQEGVDLPEPRHHIALAQVTGQLHAFGGFRRSGLNMWQMRTEHWRISDPLSGAWEKAAPLPGPRAEAVTLICDEKLHMIGGRVPAGENNADWEDHSDSGLHHRYDPVADRWEELTPLPEARNSSAGAVIGDHLYVISGRTVDRQESRSCSRYHVPSDRWEAIAPLPPSPRASSKEGQGGLAAAVLEGKIYAFGGEWLGGERGVFDDAWEYTPSSDRWTAVTPMARPRHGLGAVAAKGAIYLLGGATKPGGSGVTAFLDRFTVD
ncbi:MAG: galactose oxidase [Pseudomonadota bacterium]